MTTFGDAAKALTDAKASRHNRKTEYHRIFIKTLLGRFDLPGEKLKDGAGGIMRDGSP
jgi:hypothetical protein